MTKGETFSLLETRTHSETFRNLAIRVEYLQGRVEELDRGGQFCVSQRRDNDAA